MALIPANNPLALAGYYVGFLALIPGIGLLAGPVAIVLGVMGIVKAKKQPEVAGTGHAIVGIVLGSIGALMCGPLGAMLLFGLIASAVR